MARSSTEHVLRYSLATVKDEDLSQTQAFHSKFCLTALKTRNLDFYPKLQDKIQNRKPGFEDGNSQGQVVYKHKT